MILFLNVSIVTNASLYKNTQIFEKKWGAVNDRPCKISVKSHKD